MKISPQADSGSEARNERPQPLRQPATGLFQEPTSLSLRGKRALVVQFSSYPSDPRPRRAAEALAQEGMSVDLLCLSDARTHVKREVINGVTVRRLPIQRTRGGKLNYLWQYGRFILYSFLILGGKSLRRRYHLVHVHNMPDVLVFSALIPWLLGAKIILDLHDPMPELMMTIFHLPKDHPGIRLLKRLEILSIRFAHRVLTVNRACQKIFAARSCPPHKLEVVMNSPREDIFKFRPCDSSTAFDPSAPFVIMYHGSITERHGLDLAIQALGIVRRSIPHAELRICGANTPFLDNVLDSMRCAELAVAVHHLGEKTLEEIAEEIDRCNVGIIPNRRSIFTELNTPTRIFEYLSRGKPVIAPAAPGIKDYFNENELIYFELGNAEDLARRIEFVYSCPRDAATIAEAGQAVYSAHLWSRERAKFLRVVDDLLSPKSRPLRNADALQTSPSGRETQRI